VKDTGHNCNNFIEGDWTVKAATMHSIERLEESGSGQKGRESIWRYSGLIVLLVLELALPAAKQKTSRQATKDRQGENETHDHCPRMVHH
jgi:hypothetical protein